MNILYLTNSLGVFRLHRGHLANGAASDGHAVTVVGPQTHMPRGDTALRGPRGIDDRVDIITVNLTPHRLALFSDIALLWRYRAIIRQFTPDIVHAITAKPIVLGALACRLFPAARKPGFVMTFSGLGKIFEPRRSMRHSLRMWIYGTVLRSLIARLRHVAIVENDMDRDRLEERNVVARDRCEVHPGAGVDTSVFHPGDRRKGGPLTVMLAARLIRAKGVIEFLQAARSVAQSGSEVRFVVAGAALKDDPDRVPDELLRDLGDNVEYVGELDEPELARFFREEADIVCLPTQLLEGFPRVLLEAAASGCALMATDQNAIRRLVVDGENGWLLEKPTSDVIARLVIQAAGERDRVEEMGKASLRQFAALEGSAQHVLQRTYGLYHELLEMEP